MRHSASILIVHSAHSLVLWPSSSSSVTIVLVLLYKFHSTQNLARRRFTFPPSRLCQPAVSLILVVLLHTTNQMLLFLPPFRRMVVCPSSTSSCVITSKRPSKPPPTPCFPASVLRCPRCSLCLSLRLRSPPQLIFMRFLGGPIGGFWVARARNASAIRWGWVEIMFFQPTVSMTSVACLQE